MQQLMQQPREPPKGVDKTEMGETAKNLDVLIPSEHTLPFADAPSIGKWRYVDNFNHQLLT
jgi:hypothetical protein